MDSNLVNLIIKKAFGDADFNGNGRLEPSEVRGFFSRRPYCLSKSLIESIVSDIKLNKDGLVEFEEFAIVFRRRIYNIE